MQFNSPFFLFLFLPVCLLLYFVASRRYRNPIALAASLVFFTWGQLFYLPLMLFIIALNFFLARSIEAAREQPPRVRQLLLFGVGLNVALLAFFKAALTYGTAWLFFLPAGMVEGIAQNPLPLGLSYVTFQVIAYLIDVRNEVHDSEKNLINFALFILLFPKMIAGPIVRYRDLAEQFTGRQVTATDAAAGTRRFILGLAKKALIADQLARIVNPAFGLSSPDFSTGIAWLVLVGYALQLYFDFSGYADMAIGMGQMLGFRFVENFNYPYISRSVTEFWRRWHISLSSWFRDYIFIPLDYARRRTGGPLRQQTHILVVFLLTGLWHGITPNFILWGLVHGLAIALEMSGLGRWLKKTWPPVQHAYTLLVVLLGWVFFRSSTLAYAGQFFARLAGFGPGVGSGIAPLPYSATRPLPLIENSVWLALILGILFSLPVLPFLQRALQKAAERRPILRGASILGVDLFLLLLLAGSVAAAVGSTYVASIYGGF